jgi:hypothetical protein
MHLIRSRDTALLPQPNLHLHLGEYTFPPSSSRPDISANNELSSALATHILLANNICTPNEHIISLVLGMVDDVHAKYS